MKIAFFGGSGRTGIHVVRQALAKGHKVVALVRSPEKLNIEDDNLIVIQGQVIDETAVRQTVIGTDVVISTLNPIPEAMKTIIATMKENNIRRLIVTAGAGVYQEGDDPPFISKIISTIIKTFSREAYTATAEMVEIVKASGLDWTIARAPRLLNKPATDNLYTGPLNNSMKSTLSREDYAGFILEQVDKETYIRKTPVISDK
jgi:putative NADH-flavin reductase